MPSQGPELAQGTREAKRLSHPSPGRQGLRRSPEVVVFGFQPVQGLRLHRTCQLRIAAYREHEEEPGVPILHLLGLTAQDELITHRGCRLQGPAPVEHSQPPED